MHTPTAAERKIILAKLPKPPTGKVWKRLTRGKMKAGDHLFFENRGSITHVGDIKVGAPFDGAPVSKMVEYQLAYTLVPAPIPPVKPSYPALPAGYVYLGVGDTFATGEKVFDGAHWESGKSSWKIEKGYSGCIPSFHYAAPAESEIAKLNGLGATYYRLTKEPTWVAKACGGTDYTYRDVGVLQTDGGNFWTEHTKETLKSGVYTKITRAEFLDAIKGYGMNEDGTKIAPPKTDLELAREEIVSLKARVAALEGAIRGALKIL